MLLTQKPVAGDTDIWDPNNWVFPIHECRIYGDNLAQIYSVVDEIDYEWCIQWLWSVKFSRRGKKFYLRRNMQSGSGRIARIRHTRFLHTEVMLRTGIPQPSPLHFLVDHRDGDGMNCRRSNLRWATESMNSKNINGCYAHDVVEG